MSVTRAARYKREDLWKAPGADGAHVPVRVDLEMTAAHPAWEPGAGSTAAETISQTFCKMHHEQPLAVKGRIEIDGEVIGYAGVGHRDHSFGPRQFRNLQRGAWFNATFDSGWSFLGFLCEDHSGVQEKSAVFENGRITLGHMEQKAELSTTAPEPRQYEVIVRTEDDRQRTIRIRCTEGVNWFSPGLSEWCLGSDLSHPRNYNWAMCFAEFECDGERGLGFVDRGAAAELLTYA